MFSQPKQENHKISWGKSKIVHQPNNENARLVGLGAK